MGQLFNLRRAPPAEHASPWGDLVAAELVIEVAEVRFDAAQPVAQVPIAKAHAKDDDNDPDPEQCLCHRRSRFMMRLSWTG